jgi:hypothetical protein
MEGWKIVQRLQAAWPQAADATAANAVRKTLAMGLSEAEAMRYWTEAPNFPGIETNTETPWLAATGRNRVGQWQRLQRKARLDAERERARAREERDAERAAQSAAAAELAAPILAPGADLDPKLARSMAAFQEQENAHRRRRARSA